MKLTDTACKNAKPLEKAYKKADGGGMFLLIKPTGQKYWRLKYRYLGKEKLLAMGVYPETSLAEARDKRDKARKLILNGIDPAQEKKDIQRNKELEAANTFEVIAREWHKLKEESWSVNYRKEVLNRLENDIFPTLGKRPIKEISAQELLKTIQKIENRDAREMARRSLQYCSQIFRYGIVTSRAERDISVDLKGALKPVHTNHYAAIEIKHLPKLVKDINQNDARLFRQTQLALKLMLLTFVRTGELIKAKWEEIDFDEKQWIIPKERMKMKNEHIVPLSSQTIEILKELKTLAGNREWVFPSMRTSYKHMSNNTLLKALERLGYKGQMTGHGFRALAMSTIKEKLKYRHEIVDRQLAHAPKNKIDAAYDRAKFLDDRTTMMQEWADYLDVIATNGKIIAGNFKKEA
ncbi:MAG: integrase arm-type DNA-binding domain-containing protein [Alphaproteobacteria bacterium]|nr:integrase arm-type DNA-binding domain-containing protein [Alphaproteobacteria bacterium]